LEHDRPITDITITTDAHCFHAGHGNMSMIVRLMRNSEVSLAFRP
jgi:hypothetical protein